MQPRTARLYIPLQYFLVAPATWSVRGTDIADTGLACALNMHIELAQHQHCERFAVPFKIARS